MQSSIRKTGSVWILAGMGYTLFEFSTVSVAFMQPRFPLQFSACLEIMVQIRLCHSSHTSVSGMSSADLDFLFSVKMAVSCSIHVGASSDLSLTEGFFFKSSTAFTCVGEEIVELLSWLVSIFSTLQTGASPKFAASIWNGRLGLIHDTPFEVLTVFSDPDVLCGIW
eukprot:IDg9553t1